MHIHLCPTLRVLAYNTPKHELWHGQISGQSKHCLQTKQTVRKQRTGKKRITLFSTESSCSGSLKNEYSICNNKTKTLKNVQGEREKSSKTDLTNLPHLARHSSIWLPSRAPPRAELYPTSSQCSVTASLLHHARCGLGYLGLTRQVWHCLGRAHFPRGPAKRLSVLPSQPVCDNRACLKPSQCRSPLPQNEPLLGLTSLQRRGLHNWKVMTEKFHLVQGWSHSLGHGRTTL